MRCVPARSGESVTVDDDMLNQQQTVMRRLCINTIGKPVKLYSKCKQLSEVYASLTNTDYALQTPKFISTAEPSANHYGLNMHLQRIDGLDFASGKSNSQYVRIERTYYITCKQVK